VLDRAGPQLRACECYAVVKHECDRLLPEKWATEAAVRPARVFDRSHAWGNEQTVIVKRASMARARWADQAYGCRGVVSPKTG
jgi:hypothetical protein